MLLLVVNPMMSLALARAIQMISPQVGAALMKMFPAIRFGGGRFLRQSRERQDRGGGGGERDLQFLFHISILFRAGVRASAVSF